MRAVQRLVVAVGLTVSVLVLSGCGTSSPPPAPEQREASAIDSAKQQENGSRLKSGENREVHTPFETVIVSKDQSGTVTYKVKGK
jgi:hypothetical protein